ncbi:50S ribosomal protein L9 [Actinophytocola sediminis]
MKLILTADVSGLGGPGDIVEVKDGYGRNYLLPRKLAMLATKGAERQVQTIRRAQNARAIRGLDHAQEVKAALNAIDPIPLKAKAAAGSGKLFGSVTTADIVAAVKAAGGPVLDKRMVELTGHIKTVGKHAISIRLHPDVTAKFTVQVSAN